jgi:mono/diheme cytochrome c family protein
MKRISTLLAAYVLLVLAGCGSARRDAPLSEPLNMKNPEVARGQIVFMQNCYQCHPGGSSGLGPALNNKPVPAFLIKTQVRQGLGAMPKFTKEQISAEDLDALAKYTLSLRRSGE